MSLRTAACLLFILPALVLAQQPAAPITVTIIHDDGGKTSQRHLDSFLAAMQKGGCRTVSSHRSSNSEAQLIFDPSPVSLTRPEKTAYKLIARAKALDGALKVRGAIVVHAATGIEDLDLLKGKWIAFVGKKSWPGYRLPVKLLNEAGINEDNSPFYFVGNHIGAVAALLHRDVHVAVLAEPLAKRWAEQNQLAIVARTDAVETGGWWIHKNVSDNVAQQCTQALLRLNRSQHKVLPAWIDGFTAVNQ